SPVTPHVCEEIWQLQGFGTPIYTQPWPAYDPAALIKDEVEIAIQVNGKIKGRIMVPASLTREQGDTLREHEAVKAAVGDKQIVKFIFVPGRLLNIVVK
ncbi:MAG: class I tRNA ligase family protein, partial [Eubacteriales bacterium]|nr:class I tRNA ligase family protein [Eubacteriales bacterium]